MRKAFLDELIDRNPCDAVEGIKRPKVSQQKRKETRITKEQALAFVQDQAGAARWPDRGGLVGHCHWSAPR